MDDEIALTGGNMGAVHQLGDSVLRTAGPWTPAVHRLLTHCRHQGFRRAPEARGYTGDRREIVSFLPGEVPQYPLPEWIWTEQALLSCAELLRDFHTASATADRTGPWRSPAREPIEVVCHNDFAPYNLVFTAGQAAGVIDFDYASPGPRVWDVAYLAYRIVPLSTDRADGFDDAARWGRLERLLRSYRPAILPADLLPVVVRRLEDLATFSELMASELDNPELAEHAVLYRTDARYVETRFAADREAG